MPSRPAATRRSSPLARALLASTILVPTLSLSAPATAQDNSTLPAITVTATRAYEGIVGSSTTVITADDRALGFCAYIMLNKP